MKKKPHAKQQSPAQVSYIVVAEDGNNRRFWDAMHYFTDGQNDFGRQPIVISSRSLTPDSPWARTEITVNQHMHGAESLLRTIAYASGVYLERIKQ